MADASPAQGARPAAEFSVWRPFLARAVISGVFGLVTIFWREPTTAVLAVAGGLYLLFLGAAHLWTHRVVRMRPGALQFVGGTFLGIAGVATLILVEDGVFAYAGAAALVVAGCADLVRGLAVRGHAAARDLVTAGVVTAATGVLLPFFERLGAHALLGVTGGGALITAVLLGIAALSLRHDSALSAPVSPGAAQRENPVN
ncbi:hypothetical protein [Arthrobacter sp. RIT-PI-e]|uniref:hypothetical protein n=1 Tax=Arthrobacter sp. RIT-PI-e TaxID=1681197 RepID=UPI0006768E6D|nr:hypothetical protein [Arthrobacter sp. RIT-PI-e]